MSQEKLKARFDNSTLDYDGESHPLSDIVLKIMQKFYPEIKTMDTIHEVVPRADVAQLGRDVSVALLNDSDFYDHFDHIVHDLVSEYDQEVLIQKVGGVRILLPNQDEHGAVLQFHQGRWVGHGFGLLTLWTPLTDCYEGNSMQVVDLDVSRDITRRSLKENWKYERLQEECMDKCWPVTLKPGQSHMFTQEHIHGNIPNRTGKTRVSIDIRILVKDGQAHRKWPGSYFRPLFDRQPRKEGVIREGDSVASYAGFDSMKSRETQLYFQSQAIKVYCQQNNIPFPYQHGENEGTNFAHLDHLVTQDNPLDHLLMFSFFSLPDDPEHRRTVMENALKNKVRLHFCNEEMVLETETDLEKIEYLRSFTNDFSSPVDQLVEELKVDQ